METTDERIQGKLCANGVGYITLDRPKALNAADKDMVLSIHSLVNHFEADDNCKAIVIGSSSPRAFCSGGDVKIIALQIKQNDQQTLSAEVLGAEYNLICNVARLKKPFISIMDGVTMGFGLGLSGHGRYRVVTEKTMVGMPENMIGLLPDIGFAFLANRIPGHIG
eukprot:CAMPEP_0198224108 /NCGR_PEP_ID=MMETSP1445-20131203/95425_1 /TAXON_ID=36898 /ORGANISM="Pyramimonas sp., Strain CCMP2087" /LENGTH=165 /DNA_ID=CAMNT_0043903157 /DNA_START=218 /DNA_END=712 /DNA_ORIENTATION=+